MNPVAALSLGVAVVLASLLSARGREAAFPVPAALRARAGASLLAAGDRRPDAAERLVRLACGAAAAGGVLGIVLTGAGALALLVAPALALLGFLAPFHLLSIRGARRREQVLRELPDVLDLLAICVGSGMAVDPALRLAAARFPGLVGDEIGTLFDQIDLGARRPAAYRDLGRRLGTPESRALAAALIQADALGLPLTATLSDQAEGLRSAREQLVRTKAEKAAPRVQLVVALVMVPGAMILILGALVIELVGRLGALGGVG